MAIGSVSHTIDAPKDRIWALFANYGDVAGFHPGIEESHVIKDVAGVGGARSCDFGGGRGVNENITEWQEGARVTFEATEFRKLPLKRMIATFTFAEAHGKTIVTAAWDAAMPGGFLTGWMSNMTMRKAMKEMLAGAEKAVTEAAGETEATPVIAA